MCVYVCVFRKKRKRRNVFWNEQTSHVMQLREYGPYPIYVMNSKVVLVLTDPQIESKAGSDFHKLFSYFYRDSQDLSEKLIPLTRHTILAESLYRLRRFLCGFTRHPIT